ncbi:glycine-rich domain-containing protein [Streptomyces massasporeus]|uniref:glycine-rich domain-containing protein n=1 Tax=Streptomyces massasporeus TaxID=67324 RepID=UPI0037F8641F
MHHGSAAPRRARFRRGAAALTFVALSAGTALTGAPAATAAGSAALAGKACAPTEGFSGCRLFVPTDAKQAFTVPSGVTSLDVRAWGEGGRGNSMAYGGAGGFVAGTLKVTPGEALSLAVGGPGFGDALGGKGGSGGERGGNSSAVRTSGGSALIVAGGGGGGGGDVAHGQAGTAGGENGQDGSEKDRGGKGATGAKGGAAGGNGAAGADHAKGGAGGAGGAGRYGGGGGGAGYAGGGGGTGAETGSSTGNDPTTGSGGGGSSYAEPARVDDARLVVGSRYDAPEKKDPFWASSDNPIDSGVAEGGVNAPGGPGRIVLQWRQSPAVDRLVQVSGTDATTQPGVDVRPLAVVARDKDGKPVGDTSVTFTVEDPDGLKPLFYLTGGPDDDETVVATDAQGRAQTPWIGLGSRKEGSFTVRAKTLGAETSFTVRVKESPYTVSVGGGNEQKAEQGQDFDDALIARVVKSGAAAPAGTEVEFRVEDTAEGAPRFEGEDRVVRVKTDDSGKATAPALTAGEGTGTYTVAASVGDAMTQFAVEVVPGDGGSEEPGPGDESPSPSASPTTDPSPSAEPSPSTSTGTSGTTGGDGTSTTGGTSTDLDGGSLASTGAGGIGVLLAAAAALAAVGFAAFRLAPRLKLRSRDNA